MEAGSTASHSEKTGICTEGIHCACGYEMYPATSGHNWGAWQHLTTSHTRTCGNPGCGMTQSGNCSGGTATCTDQAICEVCGESYGDKDPTNHTGTQEWTQTAATHEKKWSCCGAGIIPMEPHDWANGACTRCGYGCQHSYEWQSANGEYWQHCTLCGLDLNKKAIPEIVINGADRVCRTQDYTFSFTLPEGVVSAQAGYGFTLMGSDVLLTEENGVYTGVVKAEWYDANESSFVLSVYAQTDDDFVFSADQIVTILDEHTGGTATCTDKAVCQVCGESYGDKDLTNHTGTQEWTQTAATHEKKWSCCGAEIIPMEPHDWANGACTQCGYSCQHSYEWQSENGEYWQRCTLCGLDLNKKAIPEIVINGADRVCRTQDYTFSFTLPEGVVSAQAGYGFTLMGSDAPLTEENGVYTGVVKAEWYDANESSSVLSVYAQTDDDFVFSAERIVTILDDHTGGTATCTDKAVCQVCGESYGDLDPNHHADLRHVDAKAATKDAEGNIEYWHCEDCGKYFADQDAAKEITQAATVTAKLPAETPATGDMGRTALWAALLLISGTAAAVTVSRKNRRSEK